MKKLIFFALFAFAAFSCAKENQDGKEVNNVEDGQLVPINFSSGVLSSRAIVESDPTGKPAENMLISLLRGEDGTVASRDYDPLKNCLATIPKGTNNIVPVETQYFAPLQKARFLAVHPQIGTEGVTIDRLTVTFPITNGDVDVMTADARDIPYKHPTPTEFTFAHRLARVRLVIKADNDEAAKTTLTAASLNVFKTVNLVVAGATGILTFNSVGTKSLLSFKKGAISLKLTTAEQTVGDIMVFSEQYTAVNLTFSDRPVATDYTFAAPITPKAGYITTITATVSVSAITFTSKVTAWKDAAAGDNGSVGIN